MASATTTVVDRLREATNGHDLDALVDCFTEDYRNDTPAHPQRSFGGRAQVRSNWEQIFAAVPDISASVLARVSNVTGVGGLFQATDSDASVRVGLVSIASAIPEGAFVRIVFDCVGGTAPAPGALGCSLEASTLEGTLVTGAACTTEILP